jgi:hypothetical protein
VVLSIMMFVVVESFSPLPDGNGGIGSGRGSLGGVVDDWLAGGSRRSAVEAIYGPIGDWDVSLVTNFRYLFYQKDTFNPDISKWVTAAAENMHASECLPLQIIFFLCRYYSCVFDSFNVFFLCNSSTFLTIFLLIFPPFFSVFVVLRVLYFVEFFHVRKIRNRFLMLNSFYLSFTYTIIG